MISVEKIITGYGKKQVLHDVSLSISEGEILVLLGPNGSGKSTLLKTIFGLLTVWSGNISWNDIELTSYSPALRREMGFCLMPQGRRIFPDLSILDNLRLGGIGMNSRLVATHIEEVIEAKPFFKQRLRSRAGNISIGEQQQLAFARAMISKPKVLLLDEPSLGLSPQMSNLIFDQIRELNTANNTTVLIVEQRVKDALRICNRVCALKLGRIAFLGTGAELLSDDEQLRNIFL